MGTYYIPRNVKGESRVLYIFSIKSLMTTAIGIILGFIFYFIFSLIGLKTVGMVILAICAVIGYVCGALKIPELGGIPFTKKIGGEYLDQIILRYVKFKRNRKIYSYTKEEK